jgi:hypothetical protein
MHRATQQIKANVHHATPFVLCSNAAFADDDRALFNWAPHYENCLAIDGGG